MQRGIKRKRRGEQILTVHRPYGIFLTGRAVLPVKQEKKKIVKLKFDKKSTKKRERDIMPDRQTLWQPARAR
jgi:hypothetical protein